MGNLIAATCATSNSTTILSAIVGVLLGAAVVIVINWMLG